MLAEAVYAADLLPLAVSPTLLCFRVTLRRCRLPCYTPEAPCSVICRSRLLDCLRRDAVTACRRRLQHAAYYMITPPRRH